MPEALVVHTKVNDVVSGAIRDLTLTVKKAGSDVLSVRVVLNEGCTIATVDLRTKQIICSDDTVRALTIIEKTLNDHGVLEIIYANELSNQDT